MFALSIIFEVSLICSYVKCTCITNIRYVFGSYRSWESIFNFIDSRLVILKCMLKISPYSSISIVLADFGQPECQDCEENELLSANLNHGGVNVYLKQSLITIFWVTVLKFFSLVHELRQLLIGLLGLISNHNSNKLGPDYFQWIKPFLPIIIIIKIINWEQIQMDKIIN